jgi:hypothetical protein
VTVDDEVLDESKVSLLLEALGAVGNLVQEDQMLMAEASFLAGAVSLVATYLTDEETVIIPRRDVLLLLLEVVTFCQENGVK